MPRFLLLIALALLASACEPRCPKATHIDEGDWCRRCPEGSAPQTNKCISLDGGGVVEPVDETSDDAETGEGTEAHEGGVENARDASSASDGSAMTGSAMDAATGAETSTNSPDSSSDADTTTDASMTGAASDAGADATVEAGPPCYADQDKDGVGAGSPVSCDGYGSDGGAGLSLTNNDCDDNNNKRSPSLSDVCGDNIDNDCDGTPDDESNNACGGACTTQLAHQPGEKCTNGLLGACARDGAWQCQGKTVTVCSAPSATGSPEVCGDGVDNDCDGRADEEDAIDARTWYRDCDGDGYAANVSVPGCTKPPATATCLKWLDTKPVPLMTEDCDDFSTAYHPGADFGIPPEGRTRGDLNCDSIAEKAPFILNKSPDPLPFLTYRRCDLSATCEECGLGGAQWSIVGQEPPDCGAIANVQTAGFCPWVPGKGQQFCR